MIAPFIEAILVSPWTWRVVGILASVWLLMTGVNSCQNWYVGKQHVKTDKQVELLQKQIDAMTGLNADLAKKETALKQSASDLAKQNAKLKADYDKLSSGKTIEQARKEAVGETKTNKDLLDTVKRLFGADASIASTCK